jgi:hypothetical protein
MPHSFRKAGRCVNGGADPLVRTGRPRPALALMNQMLTNVDEPAGGPTADEGVRPTKDADERNRENYVALPVRAGFARFVYSF